MVLMLSRMEPRVMFGLRIPGSRPCAGGRHSWPVVVMCRACAGRGTATRGVARCSNTSKKVSSSPVASPALRGEARMTGDRDSHYSGSG